MQTSRRNEALYFSTMRIDVTYNLQEEVFVVHKGIIYKGMVSAIQVNLDLRFFFIKYQVEMFRLDNNSSDPDLTMWFDQNHVFKSKHGDDISIEAALQQTDYKILER